MVSAGIKSPRQVKGSFFQLAILVLLLITLPLFFGLTLALFSSIAAIFWCAILLLCLVFLLFSSSHKDYSGVIFIVGFALFFILPFAGKILNTGLTGLWQFFLAFSVFGFIRFYAYLKQSLYLKIGLLIFVLFLLQAIISTVAGHSKFLAAAYQLVSDLKPILMIVMGFAIIWTVKTEKIFWKFLNWFWLIAFLLIAFEWLLPSIYFKVFNGSASLVSSGLFPSRAVGPFKFPSVLATTAAMFAMLIFAKIQTSTVHKSADWFRVLAYMAVVVSTTQRQELVALIISISAIFVMAKPDNIARRSMIGMVMVLVLISVFWLVFSTELRFELAQMGVGTLKNIENARVQIYEGSIALAKQYFPLGSGLGTYGGAGAEKFDQSQYMRLGFARYWWFGKENFLMDTYWPNSIAETGVLGALALLLSYIAFMMHALTRAVKTKGPARGYWIFSGIGILYLLIISVSSPAFQDPMLSFLPLILFGVAKQVEANSATAEKLK